MEHIEHGPEVELEVKGKFRRLVEEHFLQRVMPHSNANTSPPDSVTAQERFLLPTNLGMHFFHLWLNVCKSVASSHISPSHLLLLIQILYQLERREAVHLMQQHQNPGELKGLHAILEFELELIFNMYNHAGERTKWR